MRLLLSVLLVVVSINAFASKARLQSLSQGENGSQYVDDKRNVFLNPASAYRYGKWANFEWGSNATPSTPNAEGGIFYQLNNNIWGLQLGRESGAQTFIGAANTQVAADPNNFINPKDTVNLIFSNKGNVNWGFELLYGSSEDKADTVTMGTTAFPNRKASTIELGLGAEAERYDVWAKVLLAYTSDWETSGTNTNSFKGKPTFTVGGSYVLSRDDKAFANLTVGGWDVTSSNNALKKESSVTAGTLGYAYYLIADSDTKFYLSPALTMTNAKIKDGNNGLDSGNDSLRLPLTIGMEMNANDWLTLRGSVSQSVLISDSTQTVTDKHHENTTQVGAGAGVTWKKLTLDGTLRGAMDTGNGQLDGNNLLANVGMTYLF
jgi:hypothetical protein